MLLPHPQIFVLIVKLVPHMPETLSLADIIGSWIKEKGLPVVRGQWQLYLWFLDLPPTFVAYPCIFSISPYDEGEAIFCYVGRYGWLMPSDPEFFNKLENCICDFSKAVNEGIKQGWTVTSSGVL